MISFQQICLPSLEIDGKQLPKILLGQQDRFITIRPHRCLAKLRLTGHNLGAWLRKQELNLPPLIIA